MKKIIIILSFIPLFSISQSKDSGFTVDFEDPTSVVEAIFYAAKTEDFKILGELCDPEGEGDGDTKSLCALSLYKIAGSAGNKITREEFVEIFKNAKISGTTINRSDKWGDFADVPILFGSNADKEETITLIKRDGKWYLGSF
jgi:hypothetical protein